MESCNCIKPELNEYVNPFSAQTTDLHVSGSVLPSCVFLFERFGHRVVHIFSHHRRVCGVELSKEQQWMNQFSGCEKGISDIRDSHSAVSPLRAAC